MKKLENVTFRTDPVPKSILEQLAAEKKWTLSQLSEEIIKEWLAEKRPDLMKTEE